MEIRETYQRTAITVHLDDTLIAALKAHARETDRSFAATVRIVLCDWARRQTETQL